MNQHQLQAMMDALSARWMRERAETQMTLGKLIDRLEALPPGQAIEAINEPHSYRGYYSDLAFERADGTQTASEALTICRSAMGEVFQGYKGGDYTMGRNTPVWIASYGCCGDKIMAIRDDGTIELGKDE